MMTATNRVRLRALLVAAAVGSVCDGCSREEQHQVSRSLTRPIGSAKQAAGASDQRARDLAAAADEAAGDPDAAGGGSR